MEQVKIPLLPNRVRKKEQDNGHDKNILKMTPKMVADSGSEDPGSNLDKGQNLIELGLMRNFEIKNIPNVSK